MYIKWREIDVDFSGYEKTLDSIDRSKLLKKLEYIHGSALAWFRNRQRLHALPISSFTIVTLFSSQPKLNIKV